MKEALSQHRFDVVYDLNGREAVETKIVLDAVPGAPPLPCPLLHISTSAAGRAQSAYNMIGHLSHDELGTVLLLSCVSGVEQFIYCSSAGVYLKTDSPPHCEEDAVDPKSRHKGKLDTESFLAGSGVNYTSIRPVYIYGVDERLTAWELVRCRSFVFPAPP